MSQTRILCETCGAPQCYCKCERKPSPCHKPTSVAPTELLAELIDLCEAIDAYQSAREEVQKCEDGSLDEQEAIDFALGRWKTVLELRKAVPANSMETCSYAHGPCEPRYICSKVACPHRTLSAAASIGGDKQDQVVLP